MSATSRSRAKRKRANLVDKARWAGYAAAGAATAFLGHESADAGLIHVDVNDVLIKASVDGPGASGTNTLAYGVDLNADNELDFILAHRGTAAYGSIGAALIVPATNNAFGMGMFAGFVNGNYAYAYNMPVSASVSSNSPPFETGIGTMAFANYVSAYGGVSQFAAAGTGYIGVKFNSAAGTHFGWIRVEMNGAPENSFLLTDWVYGMPGEPVHVGTIAEPPAVPEPGSLGLLAFGAAGLLSWRLRRMQQAAEPTQ